MSKPVVPNCVRLSCARWRRSAVAAAAIALLHAPAMVGAQPPTGGEKLRWPAAGTLDLAAWDADPSLATPATTVYDFDPSSPARSIGGITEISIPATGTSGVARPYPLNLMVSGVSGTIGELAVRLENFSHTCPADVNVLLVGPGGQRVMLLASAGGCTDASGIHLTLSDGAAQLPSELVTGAYRPNVYSGVNLPAPAPPGPYSSVLSAFNGTDPNGTWSLYVADKAEEDAGSLFGFTLIITPSFDNNTAEWIPPTGTAGTTESTVEVQGLTAPITKVTVSFRIAHSYDADLEISLIGPDGTTVPLVLNRGGPGDNFGNSCADRANFDDEATVPIAAGSAPFAGTFQPEQPLAAFIGKSGASANGTWRLRVVDEFTGDLGVLACWSVVVHQDETAALQPPTNLTATGVAGNVVTFGWTPPSAGPTPVRYQIEGGLFPGDVLATLPAGAEPRFTLVAPSGAFFVRARAVAPSGAISEASNEIRIFVSIPQPPSAPAGLIGLISNSNSLDLAWVNTYKGGAPTGIVLDVQGVGFTTQIPLGLTDRVRFNGVPGGTYTLSLRAVNAAGTSPPSNSFGGTFPAFGCSRPPEAPARVAAYRIGNLAYVQWDSPASGGAPTQYQVDVTGSFVGTFLTTGRGLSGAVGPGTYQIAVRALTPCAASAPTPVQTLLVP